MNNHYRQYYSCPNHNCDKHLDCKFTDEDDRGRFCLFSIPLVFLVHNNDNASHPSILFFFAYLLCQRKLVLMERAVWLSSTAFDQIHYACQMQQRMSADRSWRLTRSTLYPGTGSGQVLRTIYYIYK